MNIPWGPVVIVDMVGSVLILLLSCWCAIYSFQLTKNRPDDVFRNYLFLFTLAILFFAVSRAFGHLIKQLLLLSDMHSTWQMISPFSGAINTTAFVVIFALCISFHRFQKVHTELERYRDNLEEMIATRTVELETSRNTLENILDNSNPINITGANFDLLQANRAYYALWPKTGDEDGPVKCYESRPGAHCHTDQCPLKLIVEGHEEVVQEVTKKIGEETRDFILLARPFRDVDGRLLGMVESFQDITLHKQAERTLIEMDRMKTDFISTAAHELRTPLTTMMGYTELLRKPGEFGHFTDEQKQDFINEVYDSGEALSRIIEDLLDISRIESGNPIPLVLAETDIVEVLSKKMNAYTMLDTGQTFQLDLPGEPLKPVIVVDRLRINQVLENLLSNAVKYSPPGKTVVIKAREKDAGWEIRIEDQGIGMNAQQLERVFDKFYRADASNTAVKGLGMGMSIVKQVIEAHGGSIRVESRKGQGTTVIFTLPYSAGPASCTPLRP